MNEDASKTKEETSTVSDVRAYGWLEILVASVVLIVLSLISVSLGNSAEFLSNLRDQEYARGLITFLVSIGTIMLAFILVTASIFAKNDGQTDDRFRRAREVFATMMGVLGTIVGFYFGSAGTPDPQLAVSSIQVFDVYEDTKRVAAHITGGQAPYSYSVKYDDESIPPVAEAQSSNGWIVEQFKSSGSIGLTIDVRDNVGNKTSKRFQPLQSGSGQQ